MHPPRRVWGFIHDISVQMWIFYAIPTTIIFYLTLSPTPPPMGAGFQDIIFVQI